MDSRYDLKGNYEPSESEDGYSEDEKQILKSVRQRGQSESSGDEEVYAFSESDDDKADVADSDVEGQEGSGDDLPDPKAWGQKKRAFYSTDYVDEDYGGFGKDEEAANLEEQEARILQKKLAEQLGDEDFSLDFFSTKKGDAVEKDNENEIIVKSDLTQMSKRQKLQLLNKESPEFNGLVNDFKEKLTIAQSVLKPIIKLSKEGRLPSCKAVDFVGMYYELILNYCTNISFYLLLKTKKISIQNHPVTKRLYQYRQMLNQIEPVYDDSIKSQLERILMAVESGEDFTIKVDKKQNSAIKQKQSKSKKLKLLNSLVGKEDDDDENLFDDNEDDINGDASSDEDMIVDGDIDDHMESLAVSNPNEILSMDEGGEKRAITYQMAKNKGLTPRRKKEQRNPRVKHRNKYRKAKIRRKGAIREVRTEMTRYDGEMSGIKSNVKKSIKIR